MLSKDTIREVFLAHGFTIKEGQTDLKQYVYDAAYALLERAQPVGESVETAQSIAADCYHWIADRIGTRDGYSVQEHIDAICNVLDECADYFHDFPENAVGGDDEAVRIAANLRALKAGKLEDVGDAAPPAAANQETKP